MRDILFRAKTSYNGEWAYGSLIAMDREIDSIQVFIFTPPRGASSFSCGTLVKLGMVAVDTETIGQYTGLTDKNGKKVFEGDICRFREWKLGDMCWIGKVYFEHQHFVISGEANKECETPFTMVMSCFASGDIEVIGNIHDNPELLGGANNG